MEQHILRLVLGRDVLLRKNCSSFGFCLNYLPPFSQIWTISTIFSDVKIQDLKVGLELKILYILYDILYICIMQPKKQLKVQYIGIFEEIDSFY